LVPGEIVQSDFESRYGFKNGSALVTLAGKFPCYRQQPANDWWTSIVDDKVLDTIPVRLSDIALLIRKPSDNTNDVVGAKSEAAIVR